MVEAPLEVVALELAERWHCPPWEITHGEAAKVVPFLEVLHIRAQFAPRAGPAPAAVN